MAGGSQLGYLQAGLVGKEAPAIHTQIQCQPTRCASLWPATRPQPAQGPKSELIHNLPRKQRHLPPVSNYSPCCLIITRDHRSLGDTWPHNFYQLPARQAINNWKTSTQAH